MEARDVNIGDQAEGGFVVVLGCPSKQVAGYKEPILFSSHPAMQCKYKAPNTPFKRKDFFWPASCPLHVRGCQHKRPETKSDCTAHCIQLPISPCSGKYNDSDGTRLHTRFPRTQEAARVCTNTSGVARRSSQFRSSDDRLIAKRKLKCCKQNTIIRYSKWTSGYQGKGMQS